MSLYIHNHSLSHTLFYPDRRREPRGRALQNNPAYESCVPKHGPADQSIVPPRLTEGMRGLAIDNSYYAAFSSQEEKVYEEIV